MKKMTIKLPEIKLAGIKVRTNNVNEMNPAAAKISPTVQRYFHNELSANILNRKKMGTTFCVYTDYESDHTGDYTYFIGEEVSSFADLPEDLATHTIPPQTYTKFTTEPGPMPDVLIGAWHKIWGMTTADFGGKRNYFADFEVYDERASNHQQVVLDIYIGIAE